MRNRDIRDPITEIEARYKLEAQAAYYPNFVRIYIPNRDVYKLEPGMELLNPEDFVSRSSVTLLETDQERSIRRTRKTIKDYVFCNAFDMFATFTMKRDRQDMALVKERMKNWFKNESKRKGKFSWLVVPEFHGDGKSLHFHALLQGYKGQVDPSLREDGTQRIKNGRLVYQLPSYTHGFNNIQYIDKNPESSLAVGLYVQKYIVKNMPVLFGQNRYWASHALKKPVVRDNPELFYADIKPDREFENEYGRIIEINRGTSPLVDMFIEANQP